MRARGMQVLTTQVKAKRPNVVIYGIGDKDHQDEVSGHNEDDTPGVRAEDQDSDSLREHRAIDVMVGPAFSLADAQRLYNDLSTNPANRRRLLYVIHNRKIRSASRNWEERPYTGKNPHTSHVHVSGEADADNNEELWTLSDWDEPATPALPDEPLEVDGELGEKTIAKWQKVMGTTVDGKIDPKDSELVRAVQIRLKNSVAPSLVVDGHGIVQNNQRYQTVVALQKYLGTKVDGRLSVPASDAVKELQRRLNEDRF